MTARAALVFAPLALTLAACGGDDARLTAAEAAVADTAAALEAAQADLDALREDLIAAETALAPQPVDLTAGLAAPPDARATLLGRDGETVGEALFWQASGGVLTRMAVAELPNNGWLGLHFHAVGACDHTEGFASAQGHIMPLGKPHGLLNPDGPHAGNLPNIHIERGAGAAAFYNVMIAVDDSPAGLLDADGSTLIIHEATDDHLTQPIGGAGARIACGVVEAVE